MKILDNKVEKLGDDLKKTIKESSKIQICASYFSMYGYEALKDELSKIDSMQFIFSDPTFIKNEDKKRESREFELAVSCREKYIGGSELEVRLKNRLNGKAIAKECAKWIEEKVKFKSNINSNPDFVDEFTNIINRDEQVVYTNTKEFSAVGLGYEKSKSALSYVIKMDKNDIENDENGIECPATRKFISSFNEIWNDKTNFKDVTEEVVSFISDLYKENSPEFIYYVTLYNIFNEFLEDISSDELPDEKVGVKESKIWNMLYDFQKQAVVGIINKLERFNGCILADSVGLGKTFTTLAVIKYYENRNKSVLVLCPKKLSENWNTYNHNYKTNILAEDRFEYMVLYHTDLSRDKGFSNGIDLSKIDWGNFNLVVIDESHNFRNYNARKDKETRYDKLMNDVMKAGVNTKVLMLSATPVNNRFTDLKNQLALAYEGKTNLIDPKISPTRSIDTILKNAQSAFNEWTKLPFDRRTGKELLRRLNSNFDFFKLLDSVTIARSRKHIEKYYDIKQIGKFPTRLTPISVTTEMTDLDNQLEISDIASKLSQLNLSLYTPFYYILEQKREYYEEKYDINVQNGKTRFKQFDREGNLKILMKINLLKRLESSVDSFRKTLLNILSQIDEKIKTIEKYQRNKISISIDEVDYSLQDSDDSEEFNNEYTIGKKVRIDIRDMNYIGWKEDLLDDQSRLQELLNSLKIIDAKHDNKLQELTNIIDYKINNPINEGNKKIIVFSAFADTADYLYENIAPIFKKKYNMDTAKVTGSGKIECTLSSVDKEFNDILLNFSPKSKHREKLEPNATKEIDILIATDCISEGQNLQDCDYLINYDIHWNPVRIIQRFGRVDRIGSQNDVIQLVNFWPDMELDDYINLKSRVEDRMVLSDVSATGQDNPLTNKAIDEEYRKDQLKRLKEEVIDLDEMNNGISITDLGLNDFRMDLLDYINSNGDLDNTPTGMHTVVNEDKENGIERGVIYVLKNINKGININNMNQLHPFYMVYIKENGEILSNHLEVKNTLDILRLIAKGKKEPIKEAYTKFNNKTDDGKNMKKYTELLSESINSIISVNDESAIESLFRKGGTTLQKNINGLDDFELITFIVVV